MKRALQLPNQEVRPTALVSRLCPGAFCKFCARHSPVQPGSGAPPVPPMVQLGKMEKRRCEWV